jgi:hypothetical protein
LDVIAQLKVVAYRALRGIAASPCLRTASKITLYR